MSFRSLSPDLQAYIRHLFAFNPQPWTVSSILDSDFGEVIIDGEMKPGAVFLRLHNFYFVEGAAYGPEAERLAERISIPSTIVSSDNAWYEFLLKRFLPNAEIATRYRYHWDSSSPGRTAAFPVTSPHGITISRIGRNEISELRGYDWSSDVFDCFQDDDDFLRRGFGFCLHCDKRIVSICTSFAVSKYGVEIETDTSPSYQGRGFSKMVSAMFVRHCLENGIIPCWDASNTPSRRVAESIGFKLDKEYTALRLL